MSLYGHIETAIVNELAEKLEGVKIEGFPDDGAELGKAAPARRILVGYQSSDFEILAENPALFVKEILTYEITIGVKGLRTHSGVYMLLEEVRRILTGFLPVQAINARKMRPTGCSYKGIESGIWYYSANFTFEISYGEFDPLFPEVTPTLEPMLLPNGITLVTGIWRSFADRIPGESVLDYQLSIPRETV